MRWILGVTAVAVIVGLVAAISVPAQTITPDEATLKLFPPETTAIGTVDVAGLKNAALFNDLIMKQLPSHFPHEMGEFVEATGFEVQRDVDKVTAGRIGQKEVLVIVQARYDKFKVEQFIQDKADDLGTETYLGRVIYTDNHASDRSGGVTFIDNLIIGGNLSAVKQAIDRLAAPAPSVVQNTDLMNDIRTIESGNQVWGVGKIDIGSVGNFGPNVKLGQAAGSLKAGTFQMRIDQDVRVRASGNFGSPEMAKATGDMLRGLMAMGRLQVAQEEKLLRLLDGMSVETSGDKMMLTFNATGDLLKQLQDLNLKGLPHLGR